MILSVECEDARWPDDHVIDISVTGTERHAVQDLPVLTKLAELPTDFFFAFRSAAPSSLLAVFANETQQGHPEWMRHLNGFSATP